MNWKKFLLRFKDNKVKTVGDHLDTHLIKKMSRGRWPTKDQIKYLPRFLNRKEKNTIITLLTLAVLTSLSWFIVFVITHHTTAPKDGGEYSEAIIGQPKLINPIFASVNDVDTDLSSLIYSGLFRRDENGKLTEDLATSYELSADKKTYKINLRKDIKWSDGEPFTANDVSYTFDTLLSPEVGSPLLTSFQGVEVTKNDDYSISFTLKEPFAPFLNSLIIGILPAHIWENFEPNSIKLAKNNLQPTGTGPWMFNKLVKDDTGRIQSFTLIRNSNYYLKQPYLNTLIFKFFDDDQQTITALRQGDVTGVSFVPRDLKDKIGGRNVEFYQAQLPQYTALFFNQQNSLMKNDVLRLALAKALDKNIILKESLNQEGDVIESPILKNFPGYDANTAKINLDVDEANALLDKTWSHLPPEEYFNLRKIEILKDRATEWEDLKNNVSSTPEMVSSTIEAITKQVEADIRTEMHTDQTFYRKDKDGNILSVTITTADTPEYNKTSAVIARMWRALGVETKITIIPPRQIVREALRNRSYQILLYGEIVGNDPDPYPFWHSSQVTYPGLNLASFASRTADKLLEDARATDDQAVRADNYKKFQDILFKELPAIFLYTPNYTFAVNKQIKGVNIGNIASPSDRYNNLNNWYIKTKWVWKK